MSKLIIRIGQIAVALGIIVSIITISVGYGAKKAIKQKMSDFNGHLTIRSYSVNNSLNSSPLDLQTTKLSFLDKNDDVASYQNFAELSGVIRTHKTFEGVVAKGVSSNYDKVRFSEFLKKGSLPDFSKNEFSNEVLLSVKTAQKLELDIDSSFQMYFIRENKEPLYRKFTVKGLYSTEIKDIDDAFMVCDLKQIQKLNNWNATTVGGIEIFLNDIEDIDSFYNAAKPNVNYNLLLQKSTDKFAAINDWIELFDVNIIIIIILMMVVVIINMMMVLVILIIERTQSIGVLKTLGANNYLIIKIFIQYALIIMIPGLICGNIIAIGLLLIQKYTQIISLDPENYFISSVPVYLNFWYILLVSCIALLVSAVMLLIPSYFISKVSPLKAIKFQ